MTIQYSGFTVAATARTYAFRVTDTLAEAREFTVKVQLGAYHRTALRFQDGPEICLTRLKRELEGETQESRAESHLRIEEQDIQEYLRRRYPRKRS